MILHQFACAFHGFYTIPTFIVVVFLSSILLAISVWYYKSYSALYYQFPIYFLDLRIFYWIITRKCPKNIPFTSFVFQKWAKELQKHETEGVCVVSLIRPILFIFGEESVKAISQDSDALDKPFMYKIVKDFVGEGLLTCNGLRWKTLRKLYDPIFHIGMLKSHIPILNKHASALVKKLSTVQQSTVYMGDYVYFSTISVILEALFEVNVEGNTSLVHQVNYVTQKGIKGATYRMTRPYLYWDFLARLFPDGRECIKSIDEIRNLVKRIVLDTKRKMHTNQRYDKEIADITDEKQSLARLLLNMNFQDPSFTLDDVINEVILFIGAGFETISESLIWCMFLLGIHKDVQETVYNEIALLEDRDLTFEDLKELTYLDCVIKETMRLYTTVPMFGRQATKDIKFGKYTIPKGTAICFHPFVYHRNSLLYPDPDKFNPDRFKGECSERRSWTHIAFSEGKRSCIGKNFALLEMKVMLVHVLRKFKVTSLDKREDVNLDWTLSMKSVKPLRMKLDPRI